MTDLSEDVHPLGEALKARAADVLELTTARAKGRGADLDAVVQDRFQRINRNSTHRDRAVDGGRGRRGGDRDRAKKRGSSTASSRLTAPRR